jgi:hypothetical protein
MRQNDTFIFFSLEHLALLDVDPDKQILFKLNRDFDIIKEAYEKLPKDQRPLIAKMHPMTPEGDAFRDMRDEANYVKLLFSMHVRQFPGFPRLTCSSPTTPAGNWIDDDVLKLLSYDWIKEAVDVIIERSDGKGGGLPLAHGLAGTSRDSSQQKTRLNIRAALTAKKETAKTEKDNSSSKKNRTKKK